MGYKGDFVVNKNVRLKKICSFNVSNWHLITMIIPYINKKIEEGVCVENLLEEDIENMVKMFLEKLVLNDELKKKIVTSNWKSSKEVVSYTSISKSLNLLIKNNDTISIIISGTKQYIEAVNKNIDAWVLKKR